MIPSYLAPLDRAIPMVATADVGTVAADVLMQEWDGIRLIEIEGPRSYAPNDVGAVLADLLGRPVRHRLECRPVLSDPLVESRSPAPTGCRRW